MVYKHHYPPIHFSEGCQHFYDYYVVSKCLWIVKAVTILKTNFWFMLNEMFPSAYIFASNSTIKKKISFGWTQNIFCIYLFMKSLKETVHTALVKNKARKVFSPLYTSEINLILECSILLSCPCINLTSLLRTRVEYLDLLMQKFIM